MKFVCTSLIWFVTASAFCQVDSLILELKKSKSGMEQVDILNKLSTLFRDKDNIKSITYARRALNLADSIQYQQGKALALETTGWILYRMGDYTQSLTLSLEALKTNEQLQDSAAMARCYNNIGAIGFEDENYKQAIQYFKKAFAITQQLHDSLTAARSLNNLSLAYYRIKQADSSEYYAGQALQLDKRKTYLSAYAFRMLGDLALLKQNQTLALTHFNKSLELGKKSNNTFIITSVQVRIGRTYTAQKKYKEAEEVFKRNALLAESQQYKNELEMSYNGLSDVYEALGNYKVALEYKSKYAVLHDSLRNESHRERLISLQSQYDMEMQEAQIKLLNQQNLLNEQTIKNQRVQNYIYGTGLSILLVSFIILYRANRKIKHANEQLAAKKVEVENQARQLTELNHTKDKVFQLLSHDLRVPVGNVKSVFELLTAGHISQEEFLTLSKDLKPALDNLYLDLNNLLHWSKSQLSGIQTNPSVFEVEPFISELAQRAQELSHQKKITIHTDIQKGLTIYVDPDHLTSIMRNLLSNALKFSNDGGRIWITATGRSGITYIGVQDQGVGLSQEELEKINNHLFFTRPGTHREKGTGIGLTIINEFVKVNQGSIQVNSVSGLGSTFTVVFPQSDGRYGNI
jgi:signal transduction histidine kinase